MYGLDPADFPKVGRYRRRTLDISALSGVGQTPCSDNTLGVPVQQDDFLVTAPHRGKLTQIDEYPDGVAP